MGKDSGFTLMEIIVVIAIIAIVSTIAVPNLMGWLPGKRLGSAADRVLAAVEHGRLTAVKENASVGLSFSAGSDNFTVWVDTDADIVPDTGERTIINRQMPSGIDLTAASFGGASGFRFNSRGFPIKTDGNPGGGTVTLTNSRGDVKTVTVSNVGSCKIQ